MRKLNATGPVIHRRGNNGERTVQTPWQVERMRGPIMPMKRISLWARLFGGHDVRR
jgi:hypothetical protein